MALVESDLKFTYKIPNEKQEHNLPFRLMLLKAKLRAQLLQGVPVKHLLFVLL